MTEEVLEFIAEYKLNPQHFFNANGQTLTDEIKDQMRSEEKIFAFNTSTCGNGHNIKSRSGHCIVCEPKNIHFTLINFNEGFVYIAASTKGKVIKIGATSNIEKREKYLNEKKGYGNFNDWKILHYVKCPKMGYNEGNIQKILDRFRERDIPYYIGNELKYSNEMFRISYQKAFTTFTEYFTDTKYQSKQLEQDLSKYKFMNLPK